MKLISCLLVFTLLGCSATYPLQNPTGKSFPSVSGQGLDGKKWDIPQDLRDQWVLLLIGYKQDSQFDIDRWLIGLDMTRTKVKVYELPTIQGLFPRMFKTTIDSGMRKGIPKELWGAVITIYKDGAKIQRFTGNVNPNNARVLLLGPKRSVLYFHDRGFSVDALNNLRKLLPAK